MAEAATAPSLGDFFKSKAKKKIKAANLNKDPTNKPEEKKSKSKATEDDAWEEEKVEAATIKVEVAGKLTRDDGQKVEEDTSAPAWGNTAKAKDTSGVGLLNDREKKKFPTLAKSVGSSSINIDDGSDAKVNIATSKNHFAALEGEEEDEQGAKRPKEIKPAMVTKKKGEREKVALQREMDKYTTKKPKKKDRTEEDDDDEDEEEEDEEEEEGAGAEEETAKEEAKEEARQQKLAQKKEDKKDEKKVKKPAQEEEEEEKEEDLMIQVDLEKSKEKYQGRKKLPTKDLPREELEEEKENKPKQQPSGKKKKQFVEEETEKKLAYAPF